MAGNRVGRRVEGKLGMVIGSRISGRRARLSGARSVAIVLAAAGTLFVAGCEEKPDELARAVRDARNTLISASGGGGGGMPSVERERAYSKVISSLQGKIGAARSEGSTAAAKLLIAQAQAGQAEIAARAQRELQSELVLGVSEARAQFELYLSLRAGATAMGKPTTTDIEEQITTRLSELEKKISGAEDALRTAKDYAADVRAAAERMSEQVTRLRSSADQLRASSLDLNAVERAKHVAQAVEQDRQADEVEKDQATRLLELQEAEHRVSEFETTVAGLQSQRESQTKSRTQLVEIGRSYQVGAGEARSEAEKTSELIQQSVERLSTLVKDQLTPAWESASGKYQAASSSIGQARALQPTSLAGAYEHAVAGLHLSYAESLEVMVGLLERMSDDSTGLPGRESMRATIADLQERHKSAIEKAGESYSKAASSFQSARASGQTGEAMRALAEQLDRTGRRLRGEPEPAADGSVPSEPAPAVDELPMNQEQPVDESTMSNEPAQEEPAAEPAPTDETTPPADEPASDPEPETPPADDGGESPTP